MYREISAVSTFTPDIKKHQGQSILLVRGQEKPGGEVALSTSQHQLLLPVYMYN